LSISKIYIESMNRACYPINTQMNSNICNASIFTNSFISNPNNRVRIQDENHKKQINTCLIKEDNGIYWYIYKIYVIICIKLNSSSLQVLYLYKKGELLMNQRKSLKELNLLDRFLFDEAMEDPENVNLLNEVLIIMITPFDLFGYDLYRYTFQMTCEEVPELKLDDGATRIFLNTHGKHPEFVSPELIELLKYMEHSTERIVKTCESERIQAMHKRICQIKASEKTEVKYMQAWEERLMVKQEGIKEGEKIILRSQISKKLDKKYSAEQIAEMLELDVADVEKIIKELQDKKE